MDGKLRKQLGRYKDYLRNIVRMLNQKLSQTEGYTNHRIRSTLSCSGNHVSDMSLCGHKRQSHIQASKTRVCINTQLMKIQRKMKLNKPHKIEIVTYTVNNQEIYSFNRRQERCQQSIMRNIRKLQHNNWKLDHQLSQFWLGTFVVCGFYVYKVTFLFL